MSATATELDAASRPALQLGPLEVWPPVVLAPMAGVTNAAFRTLCRRQGGGLYVSEMVGARGLVEGDRTSRRKAMFTPDESPRSLQLYAIDPGDAAAATRLLTEREPAVDHLDLNFGCPAPKVTRHGGGAALPWHSGLFADIVAATVANAGATPVTVKLRIGIDDDHPTYLEAGRIARDLGVAAITLHARTAEQRYGPPADWRAIARLVETVADIPVLGNGDIWEATDALRMQDQTGCAGVVVGRGCLGRPWLFRDLEAVFAGHTPPPPPTLGQVAELLVEHAELLVATLGQTTGIRELRKHTSWYLQGFPVGRELRRNLNQVDDLAAVRRLLAGLDDLPFEEEMRRRPRGHTTPPKRVALPQGWLDNRGHPPRLRADAAMAVSGG